MLTDIFVHYFSVIQDPKLSTKVTCLLFDVLFLTICATIAGAYRWKHIEDFGEAYLGWFQEKNLFLNGQSVHNTIAHIIPCLNPPKLGRCFLQWIKTVYGQLEGLLITIGGKTLKGTHYHHSKQSAIHMVNAFTTANGLMMVQSKKQEKSNKIKATLEIIYLLQLKEYLISINATGCQTEITSLIVGRGSDYLLGIKWNLHKALKAATSKHIACHLPKHLFVERYHDRIKIREYYVLPTSQLTRIPPNWKGLSPPSAMVNYQQEMLGEVSLDYHYYISSVPASTVRGCREIEIAYIGYWMLQ
ncbi:ISAs1 family transposase [Photorhabdus sp. RM96S]|uniref:ISAs1 family transposase n=1 Tax=Photorhabdus sp. RM96S TaxID=3342822 RepID=UPI0036DE892B